MVELGGKRSLNRAIWAKALLDSASVTAIAVSLLNLSTTNADAAAPNCFLTGISDQTIFIASGTICKGSAHAGGSITTLTNPSNYTISGGLVGITIGYGSLTSIGTFTNSGKITESKTDVNITSFGNIGLFSNLGSIAGSATIGIHNSGIIGEISNDTNGVISVAVTGIRNNDIGSIGTITNSGSIHGGSIAVLNYGTIDNIFNNSDGSIYAAKTAIKNSITGTLTGAIGTISNSGMISGQIGIRNSGSITEISNIDSSSIVATASAILNSGSIGSITNSTQAQIISSGYFAISNDGTIGSVTNSGAIYNSGTGGSGGIINSESGSIAVLSNTGSILGQSYAVSNLGSIDTIYNNGTIFGDRIPSDFTSTRGGYGINNGYIPTNNSSTIAYIGALINDTNGSIGGKQYGVYNAGTIGSINNAGIVDGIGDGIRNNNLITSIVNSGQIIGETQIGILNSGGSIGSLQNTGLISGGQIGVELSSNAKIGNFSNTSGTNIATIHGGVAGIRIGTSQDRIGSIGVLSNLGIITGDTVGIENFGTIGTLINSQGGNVTPLTFSGNLPTSYQEYISSSSQYGQLVYQGTIPVTSGTMDFSVAYAADPTGTYTSVLSGIDASHISVTDGSFGTCGTLSCYIGSSNGYSWELVLQSNSSTVWDLMFLGGVMAAPELDGSLVPRALLLMFIAYLLSGGTWPLTARQRADQ